jgi:N utilization substance protein B
LALKVLYQVDVGHADPAETLERTLAGEPEAVASYVRILVTGTLEHLEETDRRLGAAAVGWRPERMARVDRAVLRLAAYEIFHREDVPFAVAVNEAVELGKRYSGQEAARFINGVLSGLSRGEGGTAPDPDSPVGAS